MLLSDFLAYFILTVMRVSVCVKGNLHKIYCSLTRNLRTRYYTMHMSGPRRAKRGVAPPKINIYFHPSIQPLQHCTGALSKQQAAEPRSPTNAYLGYTLKNFFLSAPFMLQNKLSAEGPCLDHALSLATHCLISFEML